MAQPTCFASLPGLVFVDASSLSTPSSPAWMHPANTIAAVERAPCWRSCRCSAARTCAGTRALVYLVCALCAVEVPQHVEIWRSLIVCYRLIVSRRVSAVGFLSIFKIFIPTPGRSHQQGHNVYSAAHFMCRAFRSSYPHRPLIHTVAHFTRIDESLRKLAINPGRASAHA